MKNRVIEVLIMIILILLIIYIQSPKTYATDLGEFLNNARGESGKQPLPPTPPDTPLPGPTEPSGPTERIVYHDWYKSISGNVYESIGSVYREGEALKKDDSGGQIGVQDILVIASSDSDTQVARTDAKGNYTFNNLKEGKYKLTFKYGVIEGENEETTINMLDENAIKNVLKYNGYDYLVTQLPREKIEDRINIEQIEVTNAGKGVAQVYIAIDCSPSMTDTIIEIDGVSKTRLQIQIEAAQQLIDSLLESGQNIYVGLIFFAGQNYRAASLQKNAGVLKAALNNIGDTEWNLYNTNIVGALEKAEGSFWNNGPNSNRYIILLSDGIPTSDGIDDDEVYSDLEDDYEVLNRLYRIRNKTEEKVRQLKDDGVYFISLFTKSNNSMEQDFVKYMFDQSNKFLYVQDGWDTFSAITEDIKTEILSTTQVSDIPYEGDILIIEGKENTERREAVENIFKNDKFFYKNTFVFDTIDTYNSASTESKDNANWIANNLWKDVDGGTYSIDGEKPRDYKEKVTDSDTGEEITIKHVYVEQAHTANLYIARRPRFSLKTTTVATGLEIILADHSVLDLQTRNVDDLKNADKILPIIATVDEELTHGAMIQIEYTIYIQNNSNLTCTYLELINHLPKGFQYMGDIQLITLNNEPSKKTNSDYKWNIVSLVDLKNTDYVSQYTLDKFGKRTSIKLVRDYNEDGFYIKPNESYSVKYVASMLISSIDTLKEISDFNDYAEVLKYHNDQNARMVIPKEEIKSGTIHITSYEGIYPGNSAEMDFSKYENMVFILPPTGIKPNKAPTFIAIAIVVLSAFEICIYFLGKPNKKIRKSFS